MQSACGLLGGLLSHAAGNTRTVKQSALQAFQDEMQKVKNDPYRVVLKQTKQPVTLLNPVLFKVLYAPHVTSPSSIPFCSRYCMHLTLCHPPQSCSVQGTVCTSHYITLLSPVLFKVPYTPHVTSPSLALFCSRYHIHLTLRHPP